MVCDENVLVPINFNIVFETKARFVDFVSIYLAYTHRRKVE